MKSALFCLPLGVIIAALPAHSWQAVWMGREFLPRTEPYRQTKLYATVSVNHFDDSFPEINFALHHLLYKWIQLTLTLTLQWMGAMRMRVQTADKNIYK